MTQHSSSSFERPGESSVLDRRAFVQTVGLGVAAGSVGPLMAGEPQTPQPKKAEPESLVTSLFESLDERQRNIICFDWGHTDKRGLLRMHVENNWQVTRPTVTSKFFTADQQEMIEAIFFGLYHPDWHDRIRKQLKDDAGGYGRRQSVAIFGQPGEDKFEFVMTGRHLTIRCDGNSTQYTAFGGPIFYGHAAQDFFEEPNHPGNVFWSQAVVANELYRMLDGKQRSKAVVKTSPDESAVHFRGQQGNFSGLPVAEMSLDQQEHLEKVLAALVEPYRESDRKEVRACLKAQGGLKACSLAFYSDDDLGNDQVWDNWRLEGPAFVWHFRGAPHVHVWVNVASQSDVKITTAG